ncbi:hypothetical protein CJU90_2829 [Yarrowia sp. C11]|nr:hypothetical protein CKK34_4276 [Yarrowia sp. E02]KAG5369378.1 hypothetical protein CJU90_2829 [Yarrowia sp. C11]
MRKGLSSQPVESHPNRTELELLFVPPEHNSNDAFELKYPYPDESPYLESYDVVPYLGDYPEAYSVENYPGGYPFQEGGNGYPYPVNQAGYPYLVNQSPNGYHDNPYGSDIHSGQEKLVSSPPEEKPDSFIVYSKNPSGFNTVNSDSPSKAVRFPFGTIDIHPPPVDRVMTPHHVSAWKRDKHPILTAESSIGELSDRPGFTLEEEQKFLYEGLCEQLLRRRAQDVFQEKTKSDRMSQHTLNRLSQEENRFSHQENRLSHQESLHSVRFGDENHQFIHLPGNRGSMQQPMSKFSSSGSSLLTYQATDPTPYTGDSFLSEQARQFASVQDSIQVAVNRGIEGRYGMVYSGDARGTPSVYNGGPAEYDTSPLNFGGSSRDCMLLQIRNRVSSTATLFKRAVSRPFRHRSPKSHDEVSIDWRPTSSRGKRGVSRLFRRSLSTKLVPLNDSNPIFVVGDDGSMRCGEQGWWTRKLNSGAPTFL